MDCLATKLKGSVSNENLPILPITKKFLGLSSGNFQVDANLKAGITYTIIVECEINLVVNGFPGRDESYANKLFEIHSSDPNGITFTPENDLRALYFHAYNGSSGVYCNVYIIGSEFVSSADDIMTNYAVSLSSTSRDGSITMTFEQGKTYMFEFDDRLPTLLNIYSDSARSSLLLGQYLMKGTIAFNTTLSAVYLTYWGSGSISNIKVTEFVED